MCKQLKQNLQKGYAEKEAANLKADLTKFQLLESLKQDVSPSPFTSSADITNYINMKKSISIQKRIT